MNPITCLHIVSGYRLASPTHHNCSCYENVDGQQLEIRDGKSIMDRLVSHFPMRFKLQIDNRSESNKDLWSVALEERDRDQQERKKG